MSDGRIKTLKRADPAEIDTVQKRYQHISDTIDDTVAKLRKIIDAGSDALVGEWVEPLKKDATSIHDSLSKAAVRYHDVATEIDRYQPDLQHAIDEVTAAENEQDDGTAAVKSAAAMPDPQKGPDGTVSPEEQQKAADKERAQDEAQSRVTAAKNRLEAALDALDVAGKRFGDAVNCKNYDDGLTDSLKDKIMAVLKKISDIFAVVALVLTALAFLIPGVNGLAMAAFVVGAVLLISDIALLAGGEGSALSVALDAVGLGIGGLAARLGNAGKSLDDYRKLLGKKVPPIGIKPPPGGGKPVGVGSPAGPSMPAGLSPRGRPVPVGRPSGRRPPPLPKGLNGLPRAIELLDGLFSTGVGLIYGGLQTRNNPVVTN
ncbi:WXG100 family type VII secretion target [Actinoplanes sp. NPDC020271]|uniref:WXG100 family type VII secretion target n=1 Tax=Actinoplanes sp. NPDC020271 TaxID=3363896 RepID=UPI00379C382C